MNPAAVPAAPAVHRPDTPRTETRKSETPKPAVPAPKRSDPVPPPPAAAPAVAESSQENGLFFDDDFSQGTRCARDNGQRGFGWGEARHGKTDSVIVVEDTASPSGCALAFVFQGNPDLADDAWAEQRFRLGKPEGEALREVFIGFVLKTPANYAHRDGKGGDNNKLLRLWDQSYAKSMVHLGMSTTTRKNPPGSSVMIVEYGTAKGTGSFNTGPWFPVMRPGAVDTVGYYVRTSSGTGIQDGLIRVWWNRRLVYEQTRLPLTKSQAAPGAYNGFGNGYFLGWANSGFSQRTELRVWRFLIAPEPVPWFLPPGR